MNCDIERDLRARLVAMTPEQRMEFIACMPPGELLRLDTMFETWAEEGQLPPTTDSWRVWLLMAGRGFGKTRAGAEWIHRLAMTGSRRIALVGASIDEARRVMIEGASGLLSVARRLRIKVRWEPSLGRIGWPSGASAELFSGDHPDGLRGPEHDFAWCDELAKWRRAEETWDNLQMGLRRGTRPRVLVTTTPRPMALLQRLRDHAQTVVTGGRTADNPSLPEAFVTAMDANYAGTRLGRQELDGELMGEAEGALFPRALIEASRGPVPIDCERVVVAVDPPAGIDGDACGIVVAGRAAGLVHVLDDRSVAAGRPERWARAAVEAAARWGASHIVAEANQGGAMVRSVIEAADGGVRVKLVHATRGKSARAEPVAVRMERGRVKLAGTFPELEAELAGMQAGGTYDGPGRSPDRADAFVWAVRELSETASGLPRIRML